MHQTVDHSALKTNQSFIIGLNILAYVFDVAWLAIIVTLVMAFGTLLKMPGFGFVYKGFLKPNGLLQPDVVRDNPEPHRFSQGFGAVFMAAASVALLTGADSLGWGLVWIVVALAALNLAGGFCVGCAMYYWLHRLHVPGFVKSPPPGVVPGRRPEEE